MAPGTRRGDDNLGILERRVECIEGHESVPGAPRGCLGAPGRAAHRDPGGAGGAQLVNDDIAHIGKTHDEQPGVRQIALDVAGNTARGRRDRYRMMAYLGLGPDPFRDRVGGLQERFKLHSDHAAALRETMSLLDLPEHLRFAHRLTVERRGDGENLANGSLVAILVNLLRDSVSGFPRSGDQHLPHDFRAAVRIGRNRLDFHAVAGRQDNGLGNALLRQSGQEQRGLSLVEE